MNDTTPKMRVEFRKRIGATTPSERLRMMSGMFSTAKVLVGAATGDADDGDDLPQVVFFRRMYKADFNADEIAVISEHLKATLAR